MTMNKKLLLCCIAIMACAGSLMAQVTATPAQKTKAAVTKLSTELDITEAQRVKAMRVFDLYYTKKPTTTPNGMAALNTMLDNKLKNILTADQLEAFKQKVLPTLD